MDATQGVQAQTVANLRLAEQAGLVLLPVINKIDSANAQIAATEKQIRQLNPELAQAPILHISAKTGQGVSEVLEAIVHYLPAPQGQIKAPLKALIFDSVYIPLKELLSIYDSSTVNYNKMIKYNLWLHKRLFMCMN